MRGEYGMIYPSDIENSAKERRRIEEEKCSHNFHLCICYLILCFSCFLLVQAIVALIILHFDDEYDMHIEDSSSSYDNTLIDIYP
tara:strand:- start:240 stop:494 length:255 start_codon:yes stop_codon:yes gene_type:complete